LQVQDETGNGSSCTRTFTVSDVTAPTITSCGSNRSASADDSCQAAVPDFTTAVVATDNWTASASLIIMQSPAAGTLVGLGDTTVTLQVQDEAGNEST